MSAAESIVPKEWMTAAEIAALKLNGAPSTKQGVNLLADRECWRKSSLARQRAGRGGGWEYHHKLLPPDAAADFELRMKRIADVGKGEALAKCASQELTDERPAAERLTVGQRVTMEGRAALLTEIDRLVLTGAGTRSRAVDRLTAALKAADQTDPLAVAAKAACERRRGPSRSQLFEWLRFRQQLGLLGLAPKVKRRKADLPDWFEGWLAFYAKPAKPCISEALDEYRRSLPDLSKAPNYDQVRRALAKLGPLERAEGREGKLAMRKRLAYVSRDTSDLLPTTIYVADGKTFDAEIAHPIHGNAFRPEITSIIDAATRVAVGWSVDLSENTFAVVEALRHACADRGIPAIFYTDRGPGYVNKSMTDPLVGFLGRAHITPMKALPYNSQAKGIIERLNQIYTPFAKTFPTYIGADMDAQAKKQAHKTTRSELKTFGTSRLLPSWSDFVAGVVDVIGRYNDRPHSELPKTTVGGRRRHMTPNEAWEAQCAAGFEPIIPAEHELDEMFRPWMIRKARRGLVELFDNQYFLLDLEAFDGEDVVVGYDTIDASKVWVRRIDMTANGREPGAMIGIAVFGGNKTSYVPVSARDKAMSRRQKGMLKRIDDKRTVVLAEINPPGLLDLAPVPRSSLDVLNASIIAANDAEPARVAAPAKTGPNGRPIFSDDTSFAAWLVEHPDQVRPGDAAHIREMLQSASYRDLFRSHGIDIDALKGVARSIA